MKHKNHNLLIDVLIKFIKKKFVSKSLLTLNDKEKKRLKFNIIKNKYNLNCILFN